MARVEFAGFFSITITLYPPAATSPTARDSTTTTSVWFRNLAPLSAHPDRRRTGRSREARQHFVTDQLDRAHDLLVARMAGLEHEYHLIDPGHGPFLDLT